MHWLEFEVRVKREHVGDVEALLRRLGALSITLSDEADEPVLEPGVGETPLWPRVVVAGLFDGGAPAEALQSELGGVPGVGSRARVRVSRVEDRNWQEAYLEHAEPMRFGNSLWIVPASLDAPDPAATVIRLDAGLAFGSGTHPTTRLCLEWLDGQDLRGSAVIDFGCGSGVLGIAAALKGAREVVCVDNDPQALVATRDNAARNGVAARVIAVDAAGFDRCEADVLVANILSGTLIGLADSLCASLKRGGAIALSGVLEEQADEVSEVYRRHLQGMKQRGLEGWVLISGTKRETS